MISFCFFLHAIRCFSLVVSIFLKIYLSLSDLYFITMSTLWNKSDSMPSGPLSRPQRQLNNEEPSTWSNNCSEQSKNCQTSERTWAAIAGRNTQDQYNFAPSRTGDWWPQFQSAHFTLVITTTRDEPSQHLFSEGKQWFYLIKDGQKKEKIDVEK